MSEEQKPVAKPVTQQEQDTYELAVLERYSKKILDIAHDEKNQFSRGECILAQCVSNLAEQLVLQKKNYIALRTRFDILDKALADGIQEAAPILEQLAQLQAASGQNPARPNMAAQAVAQAAQEALQQEAPQQDAPQGVTPQGEPLGEPQNEAEAAFAAAVAAAENPPELELNKMPPMPPVTSIVRKRGNNKPAAATAPAVAPVDVKAPGGAA